MQRPVGPVKPEPIEAHSRESAFRFVEALVAAVFRVPPETLREKSRGPAQIAFARQTAMYLAHVSLGMSLADVGELFGRDRTTVAHACARIEDSRSAGRLDRLFDCLEAALLNAPACSDEGLGS